MGIRTDLAMEAKALWEKSAGKTTKLAGVRARERERDGFAVTDVHILDRRGEAALGKPAGRYVTLELPPLARDVRPAAEALAGGAAAAAAPAAGAGCARGRARKRSRHAGCPRPLCLRGLFLTRHLIRHLPEQFGGVRPVSAVAPGVLATTGMESLELVRGAVRHVRPACVLAVDALAAAAPERLCRTFQLSDAGIVPGSGVGNARAALQKRTLGVPVFCLGVPTVLDAGTLGGPRGMIVTPRDIDAQVRFLGRVAADAVNLALHPEISYDDFAQFIPNR